MNAVRAGTIAVLATLGLGLGSATAQGPPRTTVDLGAGPFLGDRQTSGVGLRLAGLGDVTGDGIADVSVTAGGIAYVVPGPVPTASGAGRIRTKPGFGPATVVRAGDLDADGIGDMAVVGPGGTWIVWGARGPATVDLTRPGAAATPIQLNGFTGSVAALGDYDGDGFDDLAVGAPFPGAGDGRALVVYGRVGRPDGPLVPLPVAGGLTEGTLPAAVAGPGDLDGDGHPELVVSAQRTGLTTAASQAPGVWIVRGDGTRDPVDLAAAVPRVVRLRPGDPTSSPRPFPAGDVNGDGARDLAVLDPVHGRRPGTTPVGLGAGRVSVVLGGPDLADRDLEALGPHGLTVAASAADLTGLTEAGVAVTDTDRDGRDELVVGGLVPDGLGGVTDGLVVLRGGTAPGTYTAADPRAVAEHVVLRASERTGVLQQLAAVGDQDGDGVPDLLLGLPAAAGRSCRTTDGTAALLSGVRSARQADPPIDLEAPVRLVGTDRSDRFRGYRGDDVLVGAGADDCLDAGLAGTDRLDGGPGDDELVDDGEEQGTDVLLGGPGADTIRHRGGPAGIDAGPGDDTVRDGGSGVVLLGDGDDDYDGILPSIADPKGSNGGRHRVDGGAGRDRVAGSRARDVLRGGDGGDRLDGRAGDDTLLGGAGADDLRGGDGDDRLVGGPGRDVLRPGRGVDRVEVRDGVRDVVRCEGDRDRVVADRLDRLIGCARARVTRR